MSKTNLLTKLLLLCLCVVGSANAWADPVTIGITNTTTTTSKQETTETLTGSGSDVTVAKLALSASTTALSVYTTGDKTMNDGTSTSVYSTKAYKWNKNTGTTINDDYMNTNYPNEYVGFSFTVAEGKTFSISGISAKLASTANHVFRIRIETSTGDVLYTAAAKTINRSSDNEQTISEITDDDVQNLGAGTYNVKAYLAFNSTSKYFVFTKLQVTGTVATAADKTQWDKPTITCGDYNPSTIKWPVTITSESGSKVKYSTDGGENWTTDGDNSVVLNLDPETTVKAVATDTNDPRTYTDSDERSYTTEAQPSVDVPVYTIGSYDYTHHGYAVTISCETGGATLKYITTNSSAEGSTLDFTEATTYSGTFYATGTKIAIEATKTGYVTSYDDKSKRYTINAAPSETSPEILIPFNTSGDAAEQNVDHVYKSVNITGASKAIGGSIGNAGTHIKYRTNQNSNTITINVNDGYLVTGFKIEGYSNNASATIGMTDIKFDGSTPGDFSTVTFPVNNGSNKNDYTKSSGLKVSSSIVMTFDNSAVDGTDGKKNSQILAEITVWYKTKDSYTISYNPGEYGEGSIASGSKTECEDFTLSSSTFTRAGYIQTGWATSDGGDKAYDLGGKYTTDAAQTFYPVWSRGLETTVTYNLTTNSSSTTLDNCTSATPTSGAIVASTTINTYGTAGCDGTASAKENETQKLNIDGEYTAANYYEWTFAIGSNATFIPTQVVMKFQAVSGLTQYKVELTDGTTSHTTNFEQTTSAGGTLETLTWKISPGTAFAAGTTGRLKLWAYKKESKATNFRLGSPITIKGILDETVAATTVSGRNYGTMVTPAGKKLDFGNTDGVTAYIATGFNGSKTAIVLSAVNVVPAETPIIVKTDTKGATVNVPVTNASASSIDGTALVAGDGTTAWNGTDGFTYYYLASDLLHKATSGTLQSGKAYLKIANGDVPEARSFGFVFGDDDDTTTGIADLNSQKGLLDGDFYDLSGRKVAQPTKGLYIVNGKKVIIK